MEQLISVDAARIVGIGGVIAYLLSYALLQLGVIGGNSFTYAGMNALAASAVMVSLIHDFNLASLLLQISFVLLSVIGILRVFILTRMARFSPEEAEFYAQKFEDLAPHLARKFLSAGIWVDIAPDHVMATEGEPLEQLTYLATGEVSVFVNDSLVGTRPATTFIGELSCLDGSPATATVVAAVAARCFVISTERLRQLTNRYAEFRASLLASFSENSRETLLHRTQEISKLRNATAN